MVLIGTACYGLASGVYLLAGTIPLLLVGRFVHGFGLSCYTTASNAYVADIAPLRRRGEAMGLFAAAQALGLIVGPVIGFMLVGSIGFQRLFYVSGGLAFTAFLISLLARERRLPCEVTRQPWSPRTGIGAVDALPLAWTTLCMGLGFGAVTAFIATSTYFTGFDAGISLGSLLLGLVGQHWGFGLMWPLAAGCTLLGLAGLLPERRHSSGPAQRTTRPGSLS